MMKKANHVFILMAFALVCLMPIRVQALAQLDDSLYNCLFNGASPVAYNTGAVLIYRGWHYGPPGLSDGNDQGDTPFERDQSHRANPAVHFGDRLLSAKYRGPIFPHAGKHAYTKIRVWL